MSDPSTAAPQDSLTEDQGGEDTNPDPEPYTLQVFLLRGDPDSDPTEVAGDAWQFDAADDDEATIAALETLATEFGGGGEPNAPAPGQGPQQPAPGQQPTVPGPAPGAAPQGPGAPGQQAQPVPGQQPAPPGGPAQAPA